LNSGEIKRSKIFFDNLTIILRSIFKDEKLELEFVQENFEFYLNLNDSRKITFNQLSEGFSAFLSILMDLLMRTDLLRKTKGDFSLEPEGIVLIDEPETHFHLSMQYEILPLITGLFPKIQLIVATHSPAIISSIKEAVIYDLTSKEEVSGWVLGSSFSELMIKHFGLDNEYSSTADRIIDEIKIAVKKNDAKMLEKILDENQIYLTPSLRLEIESQIINIKSSK
jgi:predicted ATP-binding protein involved in virulence